MVEPDKQSASELLSLLKVARSKPINVAAGVDADGGPLLVLSKTNSPKKLFAELKSSHDGAKFIVFGTARVDAETAPKTVVFTLNKAASGLERALIKALKGTGFTDVTLE